MYWSKEHSAQIANKRCIPPLAAQQRDRAKEDSTRVLSSLGVNDALCIQITREGDTLPGISFVEASTGRSQVPHRLSHSGIRVQVASEAIALTDSLRANM